MDDKKQEKTNRGHLRASFFEESEELLEDMQDGFDRLRVNATEADVIDCVFRAVHSIKGGAGAFELDAVVDFSHAMESTLDALRNGTLRPTEDVIDLLQICGDHLSDLLESARTGDDAHLATHLKRTQMLSGDLQRLTGPPDSNETHFHPIMLKVSEDIEEGSDLQTYLIAFSAERDLFSSGNEPFVLFKALGNMGEIHTRAILDNVGPLSELDASACKITWRIHLSTDASEAAIRDVFEFVDGCCRLDVEVMTEKDIHIFGPEGGEANLGAKVRQISDVPGLRDLVEDLDHPLAKVPPVAIALPPSQTETQSSRGGTSNGTIRVDLDRIDRLINLAGELVIKEGMLAQAVESMNVPCGSSIMTALENVKQIASEIQDGVMATRAQPVKPVFQRMARITREAAAATGKRVRLVTIGEQTEVDKTVIEHLVDPLTHMIRNAVDHGLETPADREKAGKCVEGTITLSAAHRSGRVLIDVADDGAGINREAVRKLAIERGVISGSQELTPGEIDNLLFMPGFSSKPDVSELSGRGVGLDVVGNAIQKLGGRVTVQSDFGEGTTFSISLPLTLAVLEGLVVEVAGETMIVPISWVQETRQGRHSELEQLGPEAYVMRCRDQLLPVIDLARFFGFQRHPRECEDQTYLLVSSAQTPQSALIVDAIQDQRQIVIKSVEANYTQIPGVAAATILGDGRIALIIEPETIMRDTWSVADQKTQSEMAV